MFKISPIKRQRPPPPQSKFNLPQELLLDVFKNLLGPVREGPVHYSSSTPRYEHDSALLHLPLVCKAWSGPATEVLYSEVHLFSIEDTQLFIASLSRNPTLQSFVHVLWYLPCQLLYRLQSDRKIDTDESLVQEVIALCPSLSVALRFTDLPISKTWLHSHTAVTNLSFLHISSCAYPFYSQCTLPTLKELVLEGTLIGGSMRWPDAPSLEAIIIEDCQLHAAIPNYPSLRRLELTSCTSDGSTALIELASSHLEQLSIIDCERFKAHNLTFLSSLKELKLAARPGSLAVVPRLPSQLSRLSIWSTDVHGSQADARYPLSNIWWTTSTFERRMMFTEGWFQCIQDERLHTPAVICDIDIVLRMPDEANIAWQGFWCQKCSDLSIRLSLHKLFRESEPSPRLQATLSPQADLIKRTHDAQGRIKPKPFLGKFRFRRR